MKYPKFLSLTLFFIILVSCKKDKGTPVETSTSPVTQPPPAPPKKIDTLKPSSPYFPAFPGSWWKYQTAKKGTIIPTSDTITKKTGPNYIKAFNGIDTFYVPVYEGEAYWGYKKRGTPYVPEPLVLGSTWSVGYISQGEDRASVEMTDISRTINGVTYYPVTSIIYYSYSTSPSTPVFYSRREYYAKNVGIIAEQFFYNFDRDSVASEIQLVNHQIGTH